MDDPILFNPDNRLLGGATGDLSLYGGQSDPKFSVHQAREDAPSSQQPASAGAPGAIPAAAPQSALAPSIAPDTPHYAVDSGGSLAPSAFLITAPETMFEPLGAAATGQAQVLADWNPAPQGVGSLTPAPAAATTTAGPSQASADDIVTSNVASLVDDVGSATNDLVSGTAAALLDALAATPGAVTDTAAALLDDLAAAPGIVTGAVTTVLDDVAGVPNIVTGTVSPITDTVGSALDTAIGAVDDTLEGLGGSDPLGGVATLVSLVSVSDMFDLNTADAPLADAAGDPGLGVLDVLAGEELLPDTLLGTHHDDGLLGGDHLDTPLGL